MGSRRFAEAFCRTNASAKRRETRRLAESTSPMADTDLFRWQALFHRSREPLFLLNRRRRFLFVNHAWEELTGVTAQSAVRQPCKRYRDAVPGSPEAVFGVLSPPPEVLEGKLAHVRRLMPRSGGARGWWDLDFFPLQGDKGLLAILGKITALGVAAPEPAAPL